MYPNSRTTIEPERSTSPRPPTVGEEVKTIYETSEPYLETCKNWSMEHQAKMSDQARSAPPSCSSATDSTDPQGNSPNPSPPPAYKWAQSLRCLLEDRQGVELFQQFLKQEGLDSRCLKFWFACRGVKLHDPNDRDSLVKLVKLVFDKQIRRISSISEYTREEIKKRLSSNDIDETIFDAAEQEVENYVTKTTYPNFLKSDLYIQYLDSCQSELTLEKESQVISEPSNALQTVHEDSELQIPKTVPLTKNNLLQRHKLSSITKLKLEGPAGYLKNPYNSYSSYHSKYDPHLPASAQDSELQSISSGALTDDTMSVADSAFDEQPMHSRSKQRKHQKLQKREFSGHQNDIICNKDKLSHGSFIPRTDRLPVVEPVTQKEFHRLLTKKLNKVIEEERTREKIMEKLNVLEAAENAKSDPTPRPSCKPNPAPVFDLKLLVNPPEENVHDILDQHISRVFGQQESGQHSPAMSSGCLSPPGARAATGSSSCHPASISAFEAQQKDRNSVPNSFKHRKDHDTISNDSAMCDYVSDDNMTANYKSLHASSVSSDPLDYSKHFRDHSKRYACKKLPSKADSSSSCMDSGISLACESEPGYSKVTCWVETRKLSETERDNVWRNSSPSPVLSRSTRKAFMFNSSQNACPEAGCSQWSAVSTQIIQNTCLPYYSPDTASSFAEARRMEDENKKLKLKNAASCRTAHDMSRMKFSKGFDSIEESICHKKISRKSCPGAGYESSSVNTSCNDVTVIGYSYGHRSVPYLSKLPGKNITLRQFKSVLSKKGNFRYFFKTASNDFGTGVVFEEVTDDFKVLPMWEGKVFCVIESIDDSPGM